MSHAVLLEDSSQTKHLVKIQYFRIPERDIDRITKHSVLGNSSRYEP